MNPGPDVPVETARGIPRATTARTPRISAWRFVVGFGVVSLLADVVYEGARSVTGPILAEFGATALIVGVVTGIGEAAALLLRFVSGPLADRTRRFWAWTIAGYALTVISVPVLGYSGVLGVAVTLVIAERVGKAIRSPAKDAILSFATAGIGRGKGFAVHEAIDQVGAVIGPLLVAAMLVVTGNQYGPSLAVLAIPGVAAIAMLVWLRFAAPDPESFERAQVASVGAHPDARRVPIPKVFWHYAAFCAATALGFATFGVLSFHIVERGILPLPAIPVLYAAIMGVDAAVAVGTGLLYDRLGPRVLLALPVIAALIPVFAFADAIVPVVIGSILWGAALGVQESTLRATVADLVPAARRGTAYGAFAAVLGVATAAGGVVAGGLYGVSVVALIGFTLAVQLAALLLFLVGPLRRRPQTGRVGARNLG